MCGYCTIPGEYHRSLYPERTDKLSQSPKGNCVINYPGDLRLWTLMNFAVAYVCWCILPNRPQKYLFKYMFYHFFWLVKLDSSTSTLKARRKPFWRPDRCLSFKPFLTVYSEMVGGSLFDGTAVSKSKLFIYFNSIQLVYQRQRNSPLTINPDLRRGRPIFFWCWIIHYTRWFTHGTVFRPRLFLKRTLSPTSYWFWDMWGYLC